MISRPYVGVLNHSVHSKDAFLWEKKKKREKSTLSKVQQGVRLQGINSSVRFHSSSSYTYTHAPCTQLHCPTPRTNRDQGSTSSDRRVTRERTPLASRLGRQQQSTRGRRVSESGLLVPAGRVLAGSWCCRTPTSVRLVGHQGASAR